MTDEIKKMPQVVVGAYVVNKNGEILMMRSPKWGDRLLGPGGHIEYGETIEVALKREVKEEIGLDITDVEVITQVELIEPVEFIHKGHIVCFDCRAKLIDENQEIKLDEREGTEYFWLKPEEIVKRDDIESSTKAMIEKFFVHKDPASAKATAGKEKHGIFHRACKDCDKAKTEAQEFKSGWQRALADYKNLQREVEHRRGEWAQMSEVQIIEEFLPVYDNFKIAFSHCLPLPEGESAEGRRGWEQWRTGIEYIKKQFAEVLKQHGVEEIKTVGEKFDPALHEAGGDEEVEGKESGEIVREVSGGYKMGGKVIRAARVIVSK